MNYKLLKLNNCLWEAYYIELRKWVRKAIISASEEEKIEINNKLTLIHLFLLRRKIDPGFYSFVSKQVSNGHFNITKKVDMLLSKIFFENVDGIENHLYGNWFSNETKQFPKQETYQGLDETYQNMKKDLQIPADIKDKVNYLATRQYLAHDKKDEDEYIAISSILTELEQHQHNVSHNLSKKSVFYTPVSESFHYLLFDESFYPGLAYTEKWKYLSKKYQIENINLLHFYFRPSESIDNNIACFFEEQGFILLMLEKLILKGYLETSKDDKKSTLELMEDISKITHITWFIEKSNEEMKSVLNSSYDFKIDIKSNDHAVKLMGFSGVFSVAEFLYTTGFLNQSKSFYQYLQKEDNSPGGQYLCYWYLGKIAQMKNETKKANNLFLKALNLLKTHFKDEQKYIALAYLELYKVTYLLQKQNDSQKNLEAFDEVVSRLSVTDKEKLYQNASDVSRAVFDFESEKHYLENIVNLENNNLKKNELEKYKNRLLELNTINFEKEKTKSCQINNEKMFHMADSLQDRFQFEEAKNWLKLADEAKEDVDAKLALANLSYLASEYDIEKLNKETKKSYESLVSMYPENVLGHEFLGILHVVNGDKDQAIIEFEKSIELAFKHGISYGIFDYLLPLDYDTKTLNLPPKEVSYEMVIRLLIKELLSFSKKNDLLSIIDSIEKTVSKYKPYFYLDVGTAFNDFGFYEEGLKYYFKELNRIDSEKDADYAALIYNNIGTNYTNQNLHEEAIKYYSKSIELKEDYAEAWRNKASSEGFLADYSEGIKSIEKAIQHLNTSRKDYNEKLAVFEKQKEAFSQFGNEVIMFKNINDAEVKSILKTAESLLFKIAQSEYVDEEFDYSLVLLEYGKAIETLLDNHISNKIRKCIIEDINGKRKKKYFNQNGTVKSNYFSGTKQIHSLPPSLKALLGSPQKTISLGQWTYIENDLQIKNNGLIKLVAECFHKKIDCDLNKITHICDSIFEIRNGSAHKGTKSKEYVLERRGDLILRINEAIKLVEGLET